MTVLAQDIQVNVNDHHDFLDKLRAFCLAQGWTVQDFQQNVKWDSGGGFVAGDESYLQIESSGHGSQTLHFRFRAEADGSDPQHEWIQMGAQSAGNTAVDTGIGTHPIEQNNWNTERYTSWLPSTQSKVWFFGNDKFILATSRFSSSFVQMLSFGSLELKDTAETEGNFAGYSNDKGSSSTGKWYNGNNRSMFDQTGDLVFWNGVEISSTLYKPNFLFFNKDGSNPSEQFCSMARAVRKNGFSTIRPVYKQIIVIEDTLDNNFDKPIGTYWVYRADIEGKSIGEKMTIGTKEYIVFPNLDFPSGKKGIAVRVQ